MTGSPLFRKLNPIDFTNKNQCFLVKVFFIWPCFDCIVLLFSWLKKWQVLMWKPIPYGILQTCTTTKLGCVPIRTLLATRWGWVLGGWAPRTDGSVVNNHGDHKSPKDRVVGPLPNGRTLWLMNGGDPFTTY